MKPMDYARLLTGAARVSFAKRRSKATVPYKLEFILTFSCGSRCRTCNIWKRYIDNPEEQSRELRPAQIIKTVASAKDYVRWVSLTGGDPYR